MSHTIRFVRLLWKIYAITCIVIGSAFLFVLIAGSIASRFQTVELPNGALMNRLHFFSNQFRDIVLRDAKGKILVNDGIEFVCFNERFVMGHTYKRAERTWTLYGTHSFIYEEGQDEAIFNDDPRFDEVEDRSNLNRRDGCGIEGAWLGWGILVKDPKYRR